MISCGKSIERSALPAVLLCCSAAARRRLLAGDDNPLAVGQTFVIITAGIDLSVGAIVGFSTVILAWLLQAGVPLWIAMAITLLMGVAIGAFHGFGIVRMGLPPFIITLATLTSLRGVGLLITNGSTISINLTRSVAGWAPAA